MLTEIFRKMCEIRYFEKGLMKAHNQGRIHCPVYLSMGQEAVGATLGVVCYYYAKVFPQHRGHAIYLGFGGDPLGLRDEILGYSSGCCQGKGGSSDIGFEKVESHHGLIGEQLPLACGYALATKEPVIALFGDGAIEEDYALASLGFATTHKLPVLFVCEDNGLAILTKTEVRRNWKATEVAQAFKMEAMDIEDNPQTIMECLQDIDFRGLPFFLNIKTCRHRWHVGIGTDGEPAQDRLAEMRKIIPNAEQIEKSTRWMEMLWL